MRTPLLLLALASSLACRSTDPTEGGPSSAAEPTTRSDAPLPLAPDDAGAAADTFGFLLGRYDADGDEVITRAEYTRHDGQFALWDRDEDGRLTASDWSAGTLEVMPQILELRKRRVLGRYFQADDDLGVLSIDELAEAFLTHYDGATGETPDEALSEAEFQAVAPQRVVCLPGDESMQLQSYSNTSDPWSALRDLHDLDGDGRVALFEILGYFEESDTYELYFEREQVNAGRQSDIDYEVGLPVGTPVPDLELTSLRGGAPVSLREFVDEKPLVLIFGSYT